MLEIILVIALCSTLGKKLRAKGRNPLGYQITLFVLWFVTEFCAGIVYAIVSVVLNEGQEPEVGLALYLFALVSAASSAGMMFLIVHWLPDLTAKISEKDTQFDDPMSDIDRNNPYRSPNT